MMIFFWLSIAIFIIAQVSYAALFVFMFAEHKSDKFKAITFIAVLPLGQVLTYLPIRVASPSSDNASLADFGMT
jgi:hypothetical protein